MLNIKDMVKACQDLSLRSMHLILCLRNGIEEEWHSSGQIKSMLKQAPVEG